MLEFKDRLEEYRESCKLNKTAMASKLGIKPNLYSMLSTGDRKPSDDILNKLVSLSNKPAAYWVYGVDIDMEAYLLERESFKSIKQLTDTLLNANVLDVSDPINEETEKIFLKALKADLLAYINQKGTKN